MSLLYNGTLLHEEELLLPVSNRAFQFNDGFFETIMIVNGRIRFWQDHLDRIRSAAKVLRMDLPEMISRPEFEDTLLHLVEMNSAANLGRLKLKVWRGGAGIYTPETNLIEWLVTVVPTVAPSAVLDKVGICTGVRTNYSALSGFKGPNSLVYVMASLEKKERGFDDLILLNKQNLISELTSSNIFWYQQGILYTPSLETGCINGIMRRNVLRWCSKEGIKTKEVYFDIEAVLPADAVFSANVTSIRPIKELIGFEIKQNLEVVNLLHEKLAVA